MKPYEERLEIARAWKIRNKERVRQYRAEYWLKNKEKEMSNAKLWVIENIERKRELGRRWQNRCVDQIKASRKTPEHRAKKNLRAKIRYHSDPVNNVEKRLRASFLQAIRLYGKGKKTKSINQLIGCSIGDLTKHLEKNFLFGMTWENRRLWHIDHIRPCASFDLSVESEQQQCFHFINLRPLWALENIRKGARPI